jgi:hypothetical protein
MAFFTGPGAETGLFARLRQFWAFLKDLWYGHGMSTLTPAQFMERLGGDWIGEAIVGQTKSAAEQEAASRGIGPNQNPQPNPAPGQANPPVDPAKALQDFVSGKVDLVLQDIAQKYEAFGKEASAFFERRARLLSVLAGFVVAFGLHVDAIDLFKTFMRDPALTEAVIKQQATFQQAYVDAAAKRKAESMPANATPQQIMNEAAKSVREGKKQLQDIGVPIGWTDEHMRAAGMKADYCQPLGNQPRKKLEPGKECATGEGETKIENVMISIVPDWRTFLSLFLGGLLIGLGGPFWYEVITNLTNIRKVMGSDQGSPASATASPTNAAAPAGMGETTETPQPRTPVDIFKAARTAWEAAGKPTPNTVG